MDAREWLLEQESDFYAVLLFDVLWGLLTKLDINAEKEEMRRQLAELIKDSFRLSDERE